MAFNKLGEAFVEIALEDKQFDKGLDQNEKRLTQSVNRMASNTKSRFASLGTTIGGVLGGIGIAKGIGMVKRGMESLVSTGFSYNAQIEQMTTSMTQMLGSATAANRVINDIRAFSESTPFQLGDLTNASVALLATQKVAEKDLLPTLEKIGDTAAASAGGFSSMPRIVKAVTDMLGKGAIQAGEMIQLSEAGVPAWGILADAMGKSISEVRKLGETGKLGAEEVLKLVDAMGEKFKGMALAQSKTWSGLWSTFQDKATAAIGKVSKPLFDLAKVNLGKILEFLDSDKAKKFISGIVSGFTKIAELIQSALSNPIVAAIAKFVALSGAITVVVAAIAAIGSAVATFVLPMAPAFIAIGAAVSAVSAGFIYLKNSFQKAMESDKAQAIMKNLAEIKSLAIEIGMNLKDMVGGAIAFVSEKLGGLFGGGNAEKAGDFWESVTRYVRDFMDLISLLTTNFGKAWELVKIQAGRAIANMARNLEKFAVKIKQSFMDVGKAFDRMMAQKSFDEAEKQLQARRSDLVKEQADILARAAIRGGAREGTAEVGERAFAEKGLTDEERKRLDEIGDAKTKLGDDTLSNMDKLRAVNAAVLGGAEKERRALDAVDKKYDSVIDSLDSYESSIMDGLKADRERNRMERAAADAAKALANANDKLKKASEEATAAAKRKAEVDAAAAAAAAKGGGPDLTEEQKKLADELKEKFKPATDKFREAAKKINDVFAAGGIEKGIRDEAIADAMKDAAKDTEKRSAAFTTPDAIANKLQEAISGGTVQDKQLEELKRIAAATEAAAKKERAEKEKGKVDDMAKQFMDSVMGADVTGGLDLLSGTTDKQKKARQEAIDANAKMEAAGKERYRRFREAREAHRKLGAKSEEDFIAGDPLSMGSPRTNGSSKSGDGETKSGKSTAKNTKMVVDELKKMNNAGVVTFSGGA